jgi:hypothetical protein
MVGDGAGDEVATYHCTSMLGLMNIPHSPRVPLPNPNPTSPSVCQIAMFPPTSPGQSSSFVGWTGVSISLIAVRTSKMYAPHPSVRPGPHPPYTLTVLHFLAPALFPFLVPLSFVKKEVVAEFGVTLRQEAWMLGENSKDVWRAKGRGRDTTLKLINSRCPHRAHIRLWVLNNAPTKYGEILSPPSPSSSSNPSTKVSPWAHQAWVGSSQAFWPTGWASATSWQ